MSKDGPKFGFFSIPPFVGSPASAKASHRNQNGAVVVENRNVFGGVCASGVLKRNFFSYVPSRAGDQYYDPGKHDRVVELQKSKLLQGKDVFRTASLAKQPSPTPAYPYLLRPQPLRDPRSYRDSTGKVRIANPNIFTSPSSKAQQNRLKEYPLETALSVPLLRPPPPAQKDTNENPFKPCGGGNRCFSNAKTVYEQGPLKNQTVKENVQGKSNHDGQFKPSNKPITQLFSSPRYVEEGVRERSPRKQGENKEPFKLVKVKQLTKPSPSITQINALRGINR